MLHEIRRISAAVNEVYIMNTDNRPIGVLDSGLGGISVLRELVKLMPGEAFLYYGDSANAPYGTRTPEEVIDLTKKDVDFLLERGAKAIVVACNTATSVAIRELREEYEKKDIPVIGIEPALKPAVLAKEHSKVVVMATPMTLSQTKFNSMLHVYEDEANIIKMPCPGLVEYIEGGMLEGPVLDEYLEKQFEPYEKSEIGGGTRLHTLPISKMVETSRRRSMTVDSEPRSRRESARLSVDCYQEKSPEVR